MVEGVRIARGAVVDVLAGEVIGVFAHVERAHQDGAGLFHAPDQRAVARRRCAFAVDARAGAGGQSGDVEQVLDREGYAGERADRNAASDLSVEARGRREGARDGGRR